MPYAPGVQYNAAPLYEGLASAGKSIADARQQDAQRQWLMQQLQMQQAYGYGIHADELAKDYYSLNQSAQERKASLDAQYGMHADTLAKDYYSIDQQNQRADAANEPFAPPSAAIDQAAQHGYYYAPQSRHGGTYLPEKDLSAPAPALGSDPTGTGQFFYNGKVLEQTRQPGGKMDNVTEMTLGILDDQLAAKQKALAQLAGQDPNSGKWLGIFGDTVADKVKQGALDIAELQQKRTALLARNKLATGGGPTGAGFYGPPMPGPTGAPGGFTAPPAMPRVQTSAPFTPPALPAGGGIVDPGSAALLPPAGFMATPKPRGGGVGADPTIPAAGAGGSPPLPDQLPNLGANAAVLQQARAALAKGAPRAAVMQRLAAAGIDPAGL